jgi:hypothetical protein
MEERPPGLHPKLLADRSGRPPLRFNVAFPPARPYIKTWDTIPLILDDAALEEPATETNIPTMAIQLNCRYLPTWESVIRRREGVTCKDVFEAIWKEFDVQLSDAEIAKIPDSQMAYYRAGFKQRCKAVPVLTALEESRGLKRIDLLAGKTLFRGMTQPHPSSPWVVELQTPPHACS